MRLLSRETVREHYVICCNKQIMNEEWRYWETPPTKIEDSFLLRDGSAAVATALAAVIIIRVSVLVETSFFVFLAAIVLSALYGGLGPAFFSIGVSTLLIAYCFVPPFYSLSFRHDLYA